MRQKQPPEVFYKIKVFLEISQNPHEDTCARASFLIKLQALGLQLIKKRPWYRCFPVNFGKFPRTPFFIEHLWWLLLKIYTKAIVKASSEEHPSPYLGEASDTLFDSLKWAPFSLALHLCSS